MPLRQRRGLSKGLEKCDKEHERFVAQFFMRGPVLPLSLTVSVRLRAAVSPPPVDLGLKSMRL